MGNASAAVARRELKFVCILARPPRGAADRFGRHTNFNSLLASQMENHLKPGVRQLASVDVARWHDDYARKTLVWGVPYCKKIPIRLYLHANSWRWLACNFILAPSPTVHLCRYSKSNLASIIRPSSSSSTLLAGLMADGVGRFSNGRTGRRDVGRPPTKWSDDLHKRSEWRALGEATDIDNTRLRKCIYFACPNLDQTPGLALYKADR
ncbi:hypothetical protein MSG28_006009 [Choristoneura fumiferana]|uniref:Uncharacterized protein n=1 Tax=Choristoneura fumiferana TaxID=7141 RepID=A0ACC0L1B1_CHOFU|nr:hypothetical protein MSG28_006009 [Choristoneura fumiferana]